ncbi:MAG TPA: carboxypeptidase regulatory-like domain-containing protein [Gemmatimonadaceae bacterium]
MAIAAPALSTLGAQATPARPAVCVGSVTSTGGIPVAEAQVTFTPSSGTSPALSARTSSDGHYALACRNLPGGYQVRVTHIGFASQFRPLAAIATDTVRLDFVLTPVAQRLSTVKTTAVRPVPRVSTNGSAQGPGADAVALDMSSDASGDPMGDLSSALAMVPELAITPDGLSAFGAGSDQQGMTLNGVEHGDALPRDGLRPAALYLSSYDPRQGRFSGAQISYMVPSGQDAPKRLLHVTAQDPPLQWGGAGTNTFGRLPARNIVNGYASGPLVVGRTYYDASFQLERRSTDVAPIDAASPSLLETLRLEPDAVANLLGVARSVGLPVATGRQSQETTAGTVAARLDLTGGASPRTIVVGDPQADQFYLLGTGTWNNSTGGFRPTALASTGSVSRHTSGQLMANYVTGRLGPVAADSKLSISSSHDTGHPSFALPSASVLVNSQLDATASDSIGVIPLLFGGAAFGASDVRDTKLQATTDLSWYTWTRSHLFDVYGDVEAESYHARQSANGFGTFTYNSEADLADATPAMFERSLGNANVSVPAVRGTLALGDVYTVSRTGLAAGLTLQYGLRLDAERYGSAAARNSAIESTFGLRTDELPSAFAVQPMAGFTWNAGRYTTPAGGGVSRLSYRNTITGGVREYRGALGLPTLASVAQQSGLPSGVTTLRCIGDAVPEPEWPEYVAASGSIPTTCADGTSPLLAQRSPNAAAFAPDFSPPERWTGQLKLSHEFNPFWNGTIGGTLTRITHLSDPVDVNFNPVSRFTLATESNRPVFVSPASIVSGSGAVASLESRASPDYARVAAWQSDLRSSQRQFTAGVNYNFGGTLVTTDIAGFPRVSGRVALSYSLSSGSIERRGFGGTTDGDPRDVSWSPQSTPMHSFLVSLSLRRPTWWSLTATARLSSGLAFTPIVGSDINGDGAANDRAFVFSPGVSGDSVLANGMQRLLAAAPASARGCLGAQLGSIAAPNSCRGGWFASIGTVTLGLDSYRLHVGPRGNLSLSFTNLLSAADLAINGAQHLRGWGQPDWPDPVLLTVRGFDPLRHAYDYTVNPFFGTTPSMRRANLAPASVVVDFRLDVGPSRESEAVRSIVGGLAPDVLRDSAAVKTRLMRTASLLGTDGDIDAILKLGDSLALSADQAARLRAIDTRLRATRDSTYGQLAGFVAAHSIDVGASSTRAQWHAAGATMVRAVFDAGQAARDILSERQREQLSLSGTAPSLRYNKDWLERELRSPVIVLR